MTNQIVKRFTMLTLVVGLMLAGAVVSANAQANANRVTADIPFDFIVGDKILPAGKYTVNTTASNRQGLRISNSAGKSLAMIFSLAIAEKTEERTARMVFHRYGQQYFLAEVWSGDDYGSQLVKCKRERNVRRELASNDAKSGSYQIVEVVAQVR